MRFRKAALGVLLGALPWAGFSSDAAGDAGLGVKAITDFEATVEVDKGMVITSPGSGFDTLVVDISFSGTFDTTVDNEFVVELSDPQGSFAQNTTEVIRLAEAEDTVYNWVVPATVADGDLYRVGVRSTLLDSVVGQSLQFRIKYEYKAEPQIPNSGFEVWMNEGETVVEPVGWHSFRTATGAAYGLAEMFGGLADVRPSANTRPGSDGVKSVQVTSKYALIATANGNLTTGKINMGTAVAADITQNYNFSDMEDPAHALPLTTVPDSLTFWVKFQPTNKPTGGQSPDSMLAAITVTIHDSIRYQDPNVDSLETGVESHMVAKAQQLFPGSKGEWVRYSVPFKAGKSTDPRYMLVSVTTNINPGVGVGSATASLDTLWLDDILMIYNPEVSLSLGADQLWDDVDSVSFNAVLEGTFNPSNVNGAEENLLIVEADTLQDFSSGSVLVLYSQAQEAGTVEGNLDVRELKAGKTYYLRARTTNYADTSAVSVLHMLEYRSEYAVSYSIEGSDAATVQVFRNEETESLKASDTVSVYDSLTFIVSYPEDEKLLGWYENGALFASTDTVVVDSVMRDYSLTARLDRRFYNLEIAGVSEEDGSVLVRYAESGDTVKDLSRIEVPASLSLVAQAAEYHTLDGFYANGSLVSRTSPFALTMNGDTTVEVRFTRQTATFSREIVGADYASNIVLTYTESGDTLTQADWASIELPAELTITASALEGAEFLGFYAQDETAGDGLGELLSGTSPFSFVMTGDTTVVCVFGPGSANEDFSSSNLRVYPNPVRDVLYIQGENLDKVEIFSASGVKMFESKLSSPELPQVGNMQSGLYIYRVYDKDGAVVTGRFVKM